ncbi:MAG: hypothetical protein ACK4RV_02190 [Caulobacter sp.]
MSLRSIWLAALAAGPVRLWALILAGPALTLLGVGQFVVIWLGEFDSTPVDLKRVDALSWSHIIVLGIIAVIIIALAAVRVKGSGPGGLSFEVDADDPEPPVRSTDPEK